MNTDDNQAGSDTKAIGCSCSDCRCVECRCGSNDACHCASCKQEG